MGGQNTLAERMGHNFGSDLVCPCGVDWDAHRANPVECSYVETEPPDPQDTPEPRGAARVHTSSENDLSLDRVDLNISMERLAQALGVSRATAGRVCVGTVGGKGKSSPLLVPRARAFLDSQRSK